MGHVKEPKGVDFIIKSKPLTEADRKIISDFIREYKSKQAAKKTKRKKRLGSLKRKSIGNKK